MIHASGTSGGCARWLFSGATQPDRISSNGYLSNTPPNATFEGLAIPAAQTVSIYVSFSIAGDQDSVSTIQQKYILIISYIYIYVYTYVSLSFSHYVFMM